MSAIPQNRLSMTAIASLFLNLSYSNEKERRESLTGLLLAAYNQGWVDGIDSLETKGE